eukprot:12647315-Heterocapsa_arctica.AAC.1
MTPAGHLLAPGGFPQMDIATDVLTIFRRYPGTPVTSAPYIPPAISSPPTSFALLWAPTGRDMILTDLPPILRTLSLRTFTLLGPPSVASTPKSRAENEMSRASS